MQVERFEAAHGDGVGVIGEQMSQPKVVSQTSKERIVRPCSRGVGDGHVPTLLARAEHPAERLKPARRELTIRHRGVQRTLRGGVVMPTTARAILSNCAEIIEGGNDPVSADMTQAEGPDPRGVDNPGVD
jgi:hypothetical protein